MLLTLLMHKCTEKFTTSTAVLRTSLVSVTCVLIMLSLFVFIAGVVCGHYLSQRWRESADRNKKLESHSTVSDLELKENAAYITLRPTA